MNKSKSIQYARLVLMGLLVVLSFLSYRAVQLEFDYNFENFFPNDDSELDFYLEFRETFENDNDFIIIGLGNEEGVFDSTFFSKVEALTAELKGLPHIREVISPLEMTYYERPKSGLGLVSKRYFHTKDNSRYAADKSFILSTSDPISSMINDEANNLIIVVKNVQLISKKKSDELAIALADILERHEFDQLHALGKVFAQKAYIDIMRDEFFTFMIISISVLMLFLIIAYRSIWGVVIPLFTVLLAVIGSLGIMQLSGTQLNMMTTLLPVIMLVVGMSDVIHLISKYLEEIRMGREKLTAIKHMLKRVGVATLLTSLTTALGFITLIGVAMKPVRDFGIYTAVGVILAFILSILFIPSVFALIKTPKVATKLRTNSDWDNLLSHWFLWVVKRRKMILSLFVGISVISLIGASQLHFDYLLMQDLDEEHPMMLELKYFQEEFGGLRPFEMALIPQGGYQITDHEVMLEIEKLEDYLVEEYKIAQVASPTVPIKLMNKTMRNGREEYYKIPEKEKRYNYLQKQLRAFQNQEEYKLVQSNEQNIGRLSARIVDPGSKRMLEKNEELAEFAENILDPEILKIRLTGTPVMIDQSGRYVSKNVIVGLFIAFFIIAVSMGLLFRSFRMGLLSLVPNIFPILLTAGCIGFVGIDLNMTTAIVFTVAFGIAVDDTIHFLSRYRQEINSGKPKLRSVRRTFISTGKAIIITSIVLLGGFGSLIFSDFLSTFYIGLFVCMTLVFAVITDLTLLPLLLLNSKDLKKS